MRNETKHFVGRDAAGTRWFVIINLVEVNQPNVEMRNHFFATLKYQFSAQAFCIEKDKRHADAAGQILSYLDLDGFNPAPGWTREDIWSLLRIWNRWHLNSACSTDAEGKAATDRWLAENLPDDVVEEIQRLRSLPTGKIPTDY